jgi:undecaprenyl-diphosphatase
MNVVDQLIVDWLHALGSLWPSSVVLIGSYLPWLLVSGVFAGALFVGYSSSRWSRVLMLATSGVSAWVIAEVLKNIVARPRPFIALPDISPLINVAGQLSFPSSHAAALMALALATRRLYPSLGNWCVALVVLIGVARVAAGVHWASDVVAGFVLGIIVEAALAAATQFRVYYASK